MLNRLYGQINVQLRPIKMMRTRKLNIDQFANASILEPRKPLERDEALRLSD
jgi:hypothetical protein